MRTPRFVRCAQAAATALGLALALPSLAASAGDAAPATEPIAPLPLAIDEDEAKVSLGERLFADRRLSHDQTRSCTSCHPLGRGGMDGLPQARATNQATTLRNTPTIFNVGFSLFFNWDGSTERLQPHDEKVLLNPALMGTTWRELLPRLRADPIYASAFSRLRPAGVTRENVLDAIASYERSLITPNSRFDRYLRGEQAALTTAEQQGYQLFKSYGCIACHQGINVGGNLVQKFGVFADPARDGRAVESADPGRFNTTHRERDRGAFRVPSLRNVAVTAPYFHDGRAATLEAAVTEMARVQLGRELRPEQIAQIVSFLGTLTGEYRGAPLAGGGAASR